MSRLSLRALCSIGLALTLFGASACNEDECTVNGDCGSDEICTSDNECVPDIDIIDDLFCADDSQCTTAGQICNAGKCESGCRTNSDCAAGVETCNRRTLECEAIPDECTVSVDCPDNFICDQEVEDGPLKCVPECSEDADCDSGLTCDDGACVGCVENSDCGDGEICRIGRCTPREFQCDRVGQECDPDLPVVDGFVCAQFPNDDTTFCYEACREEAICAASRTVDAEGNFTDENGFIKGEAKSCPAGAFCSDAAGGVEACRRSDCLNPVAGQTTCAAIAAANPNDFPQGANCNYVEEFTTLSVRRSGDFVSLVDASEGFVCEPAGQLQRGEEGCNVIPTSNNPLAPPPPRQRCAQGLMCVTEYGADSVGDGRCETPCTNDAQCDGDAGETCIGLDAQEEFNTVGICGVRCEPYTVDNEACPTGTACTAITSEDGMCSDLRGASGDLGVYEACNDDAECPSGTRCQNLFGSSRCMPECNPTTRNQSQDNVTCGSPENNKGYVKIQHLVPNGPAVDVYVDGRRVVDDLEYSQVADGGDNRWLKLDQGNHVIDVVEGSRTNNRVKLIGTTVTLEPTVAQIISVVPAANDGVQFGVVESQRLPEDRPAAQASIRVAHYVAGAGTVDIVAVNDGDDASLPTADALGEGLSFGQVSGFSQVPAGTYDVYIFTAGSARDAVSALTVIEDLEVGAQQATVFAHGTPGVVPSVLVTQFRTFSPPVLRTGYCYDLDQGSTNATRPSSGVCFERCGGYDDFGATDSCTVTGVDTCTVFGADVAVCQPNITRTDSPYLLNCDPSSATSCPTGLACLGDPFQDGRADFGVCIWQPAGAQCGTGFQGIQGFLGCEQSAGCVGESSPPIGQQPTPGVCTPLERDGVYPSTIFWGDQCPLGFVQNGDGNCVAAGVGEECGEGTPNYISCAEGLFCDQKGDGVGVCRSYCTQDGFAPNPNFAGCQDGETCIPSADIEGLGECRLACTPDSDGSFKSTSCPVGQQTCYTNNGYSYCTASGDIPLNDVCGEYQEFPGARASEVTLCEAGTLCARDITTPDSTFEVTIDSFLTIGRNEEARCRQLCRPFQANEASDCGEGYACTPILPVQEINTFSGICTPKVSQVGIGANPDACLGSEVGLMCGDGAFCSLQNADPQDDSPVCTATAECFELCNPATGLGCSEGKACSQLGSIDAPSYFIGAFGICRDR